MNIKRNLDFTKDWHFNLLEIYNFNKYGSFHNFIEFLRNNHDKIDGDIVEAGVYRGSSLLSIALLLKQLGSKKTVYGFDTYSGFPPIYNQKDNLREFENMFKQGLISEDHLNSVRLNHLILFDILKIKKSATVREISSSGKFSETNIDLIKEKIDFLGLDNVKLVQGSFADTMNENSEVKSIMAAVVDCDLYQSYQESLNFIWPKLSRGGFVHLDEYYSLKFPGPRKAVLEFLNENRKCTLESNQQDEDFERWYLRKNY